MKKRLIGVHGFTGSSKGDWFPWLKTEFEKEGFKVIIPDLPDTQSPQINKWISALANAVDFDPDGNTFFIGHSLGCQTILRYLQKYPPKSQIGGAIFVAGFFSKLTNLDEVEMEILLPWLENEIDCSKVRQKLKKSIAIFSENDSWVPLKKNESDFEDKLGSEIVVLPDMGHFTEDEGVTTIPLLKTIFESKFFENRIG